MDFWVLAFIINFNSDRSRIPDCGEYCGFWKSNKMKTRLEVDRFLTRKRSQVSKIRTIFFFEIFFIFEIFFFENFFENFKWKIWIISSCWSEAYGWTVLESIEVRCLLIGSGTDPMIDQRIVESTVRVLLVGTHYYFSHGSLV